jgi:DNA-directed RNA polymerase I subunit RPA2
MARTGSKSPPRASKQKRSSGKQATQSHADKAEPETLSHPHVDSFNYFLDVGLDRGIKDIEPAEICVVDPQKQRDAPSSIDWNETTTIKFWIENVKVSKPVKPSTSGRSNLLMPRECRERGLMYSGPMSGTFCYSIIQRRNGVEIPTRPIRIQKKFGDMPIMIMSKGCHLEGATPKELVKLKEEVRIAWGLVYCVCSGAVFLVANKCMHHACMHVFQAHLYVRISLFYSLLIWTAQ